jgi:hypothetical protein
MPTDSGRSSPVQHSTFTGHHTFCYRPANAVYCRLQLLCTPYGFHASHSWLFHLPVMLQHTSMLTDQSRQCHYNRIKLSEAPIFVSATRQDQHLQKRRPLTTSPALGQSLRTLNSSPQHIALALPACHDGRGYSTWWSATFFPLHYIGTYKRSIAAQVNERYGYLGWSNPNKCATYDRHIKH